VPRWPDKPNGGGIFFMSTIQTSSSRHLQMKLQIGYLPAHVPVIGLRFCLDACPTLPSPRVVHALSFD